jgi:PAS domain S-box-containing protein
MIEAKADAQLLTAENFLHWEPIVYNLPDAVCMTDRRGHLDYVNPAFETLFCCSSAQVLGRPIDWVHVSQAPVLIETMAQIWQYVDQCGHWLGEIQCSVAQQHFTLRLTAMRRLDCAGQWLGFVGIFVDLSAIKRREEQLHVLHSVAEDLSSRLVLDDLVEHALAATIRLTETDFAALAIPVAHSDQLYYRWSTPMMDEALQHPFPATADVAGQAITTGQLVFFDDYQTVNQALPAFLSIGLSSGIAYPVNVGRPDVAVLMVATIQRQHRFSRDELQLLETIARQIAVAMERERLIAESCSSRQRLDQIIQNNADAILVTNDEGVVKFANPAAHRLLGRTQAELDDFPLGLTSQVATSEIDVHRPTGDFVPVDLHAMQTTWDGERAHVLTLRDISDRRLIARERQLNEDRIRKALVQTIIAISRTVETRDPYTAGHQRRVATLGRLIACELALSTDEIDGVYMGGMIHDLGKLYIPSEILNRSGHLNEIEFLLIKTHCTVGRDIVAGIHFPWPLGAMIHQHHERLDGSGYPSGLKGEEIIHQARILAVADVVDAMSSRRPYREALGLDAALAEITRHKNHYYDSDSVDACVQLFTQQNLTLDDLEAVERIP